MSDGPPEPSPPAAGPPAGPSGVPGGVTGPAGTAFAGVAGATSARRARIVDLLAGQAVRSADDLCTLLAAEGVLATAATVEADLAELGAVRVRLPGGGSALAVPVETEADRRAPEDHLRRVLAEWVREVAHSGPLVVLRTPPGCAHVVASALDRAGLPGVLGTVAGDDTLLVVASERVGGERVARTVSALAGL